MSVNGRKAQAARNDDVILAAARAVFAADPGAPIAAVAQRAGVGISALYRRYRSKEELLQKLCIAAIRTYVEIASSAYETQADPGQVFATFLRAALEARSGSLTIRFAGSFAVSEEIAAEVDRAYRITHKIIDEAQRAGVLRPEIAVGDITLLLEQLQAVESGNEARTNELRRRYLEVILEGLKPAAVPLPGSPPAWEEISGRYAGTGA